MMNGIYGTTRRIFAIVLALVMTFGCMGFASAETESAEPSGAVRANAGEGYYLIGNMTGWELNGDYKLSVNPGNSNEYTITINIPANTEYKVVYSKNGSDKTTWYPADGANLTINDAGNYTFYFQTTWNSDWNGYVYVRYNGEPVVTTYTVSVSASGQGGTVVADKASAQSGEIVTVTVTPDEGYEIETITGMPADATESNGVYSFNMPAEDVNISVTFKQSVYTITTTTGGEGTGSVSAPASAHFGDSVTVAVTPDTSSRLQMLKVDHENVTSQVNNGEYTFIMPSHAVAIEAQFRLHSEGKHTITVQTTGLGTAFADKTEANEGELVTITAEASIGYEFAEIVVNDVGQGPGVLTFTMPDEDVIVMVYFDDKPFDITLNSGVQGTMNAIPRNNQAYANTTVQIIVNADEDYAVKTLTVETTETHEAVAVSLKSKDGQTSIYEFTMPATPVTVTATYKKLATNGYYLIGNHGWATNPNDNIDMIDGNDKFVDDRSVSGQMLLTVDLEAGMGIKIVHVTNGAIDTWFPREGDNYNVDNAHAGTCTIYFRPKYGGPSDWFQNCFYVKHYENQYYLANANDGTVRMDDHLYFNKEFNCQDLVPGQNQSIHELYGVNYEHMVLTWRDSADLLKVVRLRGNEKDWLPGGENNAYTQYTSPQATQQQHYTGMVFVFFEEELVDYNAQYNIGKDRKDWTNNVFDVQKAYKADAADKADVNPLNAESLTYNLAHGSISLSTGTPFIREGRSDKDRIPENTTNTIYELGLNQKVYCSIIPESGYAREGTPYITYGNNTVNMTQDGSRWYFTMPSADVVIHAPMKKIFRTQSVLLSGRIGVNFFVDLSSFTDKDNCRMEFTIGESSEVQTDTFDENFHSSVTPTNFGFTCYLNALQMADTIHAVLYHGKDIVSAKDYSLEEYIRYYDRADSNQTGNVDALRVIRAMSDYGYYMQMFQFSQKPSLVSKYSEFKRVYTTQYDYTGIMNATNSHSLNAEGNKNIADSRISSVGLQLAVDSATTLMVNLHMEEGADAPTIKVGSTTLTVGNSVKRGIFTWSLLDVSEKGDPCYQVCISGISTHNLDMQFTITGNAGGSFKLVVSAFSYANSLLKNASSFGDNALKAKNAAAALYMLHEAEVAYRASAGLGN